MIDPMILSAAALTAGILIGAGVNQGFHILSRRTRRIPVITYRGDAG